MKNKMVLRYTAIFECSREEGFIKNYEHYEDNTLETKLLSYLKERFNGKLLEIYYKLINLDDPECKDHLKLLNHNWISDAYHYIKR